MAAITRVRTKDTYQPKQLTDKEFCDQYRGLAVNRYSSLYQARFFAPPAAPFILKQISNGNRGRAKYAKVFDKVVLFLKEQRELHGAVNEMYQLLTDYFTCMMNYYHRYGRPPAMTQVSPGMVLAQEFNSFTYHEENVMGGYWMNAEQMKQANEWTHNGGSKFKDILLDKMRMEDGLEPIFGTTQEDIDNWDGNPTPGCS